jgi:histone H3/H4
MSENQKQSILLGFDQKECWQILKKTGISRVSKDSVIALNNLLTRRAREIATKAVTLAVEKDRDEILEEDITQAVRMAGVPTYEVAKEAPVVHYVWFISSGGTCLLSRAYSGLEFPDTIFSGLLTGILDLMSEVTGRMIEKFSTDDLTIHIRRVAEITVAVICDSEQSDPIDELTDLLALRFADVFDVEIQQEIVDTSVFDDFAPVLDALVAGVGLKIPKESLKIIKSSASLTDRQLEETVDAVALREEIRRAQETIQDLAVFKRDDKSSEMESLFYESPDVTEIKAVLRQATHDIREEFPNGNEDMKPEDIKIDDVSQEEVLKEISKDFPEIDTQKLTSAETNKPVKKVTKKTKKKSRKRKRRRK